MTPSSQVASANLKPAWPGLVIWLLICFIAPALGSGSKPGEWYAQLNKPSWNPPGWVFGPVWTALYASMAVAVWMIWRRGGFRVQRLPLGLFLTQLALNALWTPLFFGLHQPGLAFLHIALPWPAIIPTTPGQFDEHAVIAFARERLAGFETPKRVVLMEEFPTTVGGKILKYKLRQALMSQR